MRILYFQYNSKISPQDVFYNVGVKLSSDGQYGHQDYLKHASRGTLSLHSLYLLLWSNFSAFCIALLTQSQSENLLCGKLFSERVDVKHFCLSQLQSSWKHMRNNLNLTEEERTLFVKQAMIKFQMVKVLVLYIILVFFLHINNIIVIINVLVGHLESRSC